MELDGELNKRNIDLSQDLSEETQELPHERLESILNMPNIFSKLHDDVVDIRREIHALKMEKRDQYERGILGELGLQLKNAIISKTIKGTGYERHDVYKFSDLRWIMDKDPDIQRRYSTLCQQIGYDAKKYRQLMYVLKYYYRGDSHAQYYEGNAITEYHISQIATEKMPKHKNSIENLCRILKSLRSKDENLFLFENYEYTPLS